MPRIDLIKLRRDTEANWNSVNPTLAEGEYGFETDTRRSKIGDGSTAWNDLEYLSVPIISALPAIENRYDEISVMLADQGNQTEGKLQFVKNATDDPTFTPVDGDNRAYYLKKVDSTASLNDYIRQTQDIADVLNDSQGSETEDCGTVIPLDTVYGHNCNMQSANANTAYTIDNGNLINAYARVLINAASEPTVSGATPQGGIEFQANTDLILLVQNLGDAGLIYSFNGIGVGGNAYNIDEWVSVSGTRSGGDLNVIIGDYDDSGGGTKLTIDDENGEVRSSNIIVGKAGVAVEKSTNLYRGIIQVENLTDYRVYELPDVDGDITVNVGNWNASTNTPTLADTDTGVKAVEYKVTVAGTVDFGAGDITFSVGDIVANDGTIWYKKVNNNQITSYITPEDYGAVGDGVTDDTTAIQNALDSGYKKIVFNNDYYITSDLTITSNDNLTIESNNGSIEVDKTSVTYIFSITNSDYVTIDGLFVDGKINEDTTYTVSFVNITNSDYFTLKNCEIKDIRYGVISTNDANNCDYTEITNNVFYGTNDYTGSDNDVSGVLAYGFGLSEHWTVSDNKLNQAYHLTLSPQGYNWIVSGNTIKESVDSAIYMRGGNHVIQSNTIINAGKDGIKISESGTYDNKYNIISNNIINGAGIHKSDGGILISTEVSDVTIISNYGTMIDPTSIAASSNKGIFIQNDNAIVSENKIVGVASVDNQGIQIRTENNCDNVLISNNYISTVSRAVNINQNSASFTINNLKIQGNTFDTASVSGVQISISLATGFKYIDISGNNFSNSAYGVSSFSIGLSDGSITNNTFVNNTTADIRLNSFATTFVVKNNLTDGGASAFTHSSTNVCEISNFENNIRLPDVNVLGSILSTYTFATLPSVSTGYIAYITDASSVSYRATAAGGGSDAALVMYDGTNWIYH